MQRIIEKTLIRNMRPDELYLKEYYRSCRVFTISEERDVYEIDVDTKINFIPASIAIIEKENNCLCLFTTDVYFRKQKYGTQLMSVIKDLYQGQKLHLYVRVSNTSAIEFYKKNGWIDVGRKINFYAYTRKNEDAIVMELN